MNAVLDVSAIIFDLDGVLADSSAVVDHAWIEWGDRHGIDAESARIIAREASLVDFVAPVPGAHALLAQLPAGRWGVATSGTDAIARSRLMQAGLPVPSALISAEMVARGKPDPEVYVRAAAALGVDPAACLVFEDAPSGVAAATAAGATVVGVLTGADRAVLRVPYSVKDLRAVHVTASGRRMRVELHEPDSAKS